jgi:preprotein translocase subunit SecY
MTKKTNILKKIFTNKTVVASIIFTLLLLIFFHICSIIPCPGVKITGGLNDNDISSMLNLLAGGGMNRMSIFSVGVGPYITAQIIIQLLSSDIIKPLARMNKNGERGKRKLEIITRILTIPFCIAQSYAVIALLLQSGNFEIFGAKDIGSLGIKNIIILIVIFTGGTYLALFIGDMISKRGVGNGITMLILTGIVSSFFADFSASFKYIEGMYSVTIDNHSVIIALSIGLYISLFIIILLACIFANDSVRKIPIQQTGQGLITKAEDLPYLPIKLNSSGVIPVIFASSLMTIPSTVMQFLPANDTGKRIIENYFQIQTPVGLTIYAIFIMSFCFFYSYIQINPNQMAENFEKSGKFIPGVKSGADTEKHITRVLNRVNWIGAPFLAIIAIIPYLISMLSGIPSGLAIGGTGIIILVTGSIDFYSSIKSNAMASSYSLDKKKIDDSSTSNGKKDSYHL